jgi:TIR domain
MQTIPKIFLSYASEDHPWVENFVEVFSEHAGGVKIQDFKAGDCLEFGELQKWVDESVSEATAVIAFVSEYYQSKEWTLAEWKKTVNEYRRRRLVFVPIMLDAEAKSWWANLRTQGDLCELPVDYIYCNYCNPTGGRVRICKDDEVQGRIVRLALAVKSVLMPPPALPPTIRLPTDGTAPQHPDVVILGHPTNRAAEDTLAQVSALREALRVQGLSFETWNDGWLPNPPARGASGVSAGAGTVFVQALAAGEASEHVQEVHRTEKRLAIAGVSGARVVLWLPSGQSDREFEDSASMSDDLPSLQVLQSTPALRVDPPDELALRLRAILRSTEPEVDPILQIETVGWAEGGKLDPDAKRLSDELTQMFNNIVKGVMPNSSLPLQFWDTQFQAQIAVLPGSRAIVAVHDLDIPPSADLVAKRKQMETKFKQMQEYVRQSEIGNKRRFFWTALLYRNAKALPFARYPYDARFRDWRLLSFEEPVAARPGEPVRPDPASLGVFRSELFAWGTER